VEFRSDDQERSTIDGSPGGSASGWQGLDVMVATPPGPPIATMPAVRRLSLLDEEVQGAPVIVGSIEPFLDETGGAGGRTLACARCGHAITTTASRVAVNGQHEFVRTNPRGYVHRFGCFLEAPGCRSSGVPSKQATWFAGCFWLRQDCGRCEEHLGWLFFSVGEGASEFFGLILDALVEVEEATG
jgi:hypothetical protein